MNQTLSSLFVTLLVVGCATSSGPGSQVASPAQPADHDHVSVSSPSDPGVPCAQDISLECHSGVDGCHDGRTTMHACIAAAAPAGTSCSLEIALECPQGQIDGCLETPAVSTHHICVIREH